MHAMWKPQKFKAIYLLATLYVLTLTLPSAAAVYWAFGDMLLNHSNAFSLLPRSHFRDMAVILMLIHQAIISFLQFIYPLNKSFLIQFLISNYVIDQNNNNNFMFVPAVHHIRIRMHPIVLRLGESHRHARMQKLVQACCSQIACCHSNMVLGHRLSFLWSY